MRRADSHIDDPKFILDLPHHNTQLPRMSRHVTVHPQSFQWEQLKAPFAAESIAQLRARLRFLPPSYLRRGTETKRILKHAFSDLLPPAIRRRGKMGFGVPLGAWFRGDLREYLRDHLGAGARVDSYLQRAAIDRLLDEHARGAADHGQKLWALLTLEIWLRSLASGSLACAA